MQWMLLMYLKLMKNDATFSDAIRSNLNEQLTLNSTSFFRILVGKFTWTKFQYIRCQNTWIIISNEIIPNDIIRRKTCLTWNNINWIQALKEVYFQSYSPIHYHKRKHHNERTTKRMLWRKISSFNESEEIHSKNRTFSNKNNAQ